MASINSSSQRISIYACTNPQSPNFHRAMWRGPGDACTQQFSLPEKNLEHRGSENLCSTKKHYLDLPKLEAQLLFFSGGRHYPCLTKLMAHTTWKDGLQQSVLLYTKCTEMQATHNCLPNVNYYKYIATSKTTVFSSIYACLYLCINVFIHSYIYLILV